MLTLDRITFLCESNEKRQRNSIHNCERIVKSAKTPITNTIESAAAAVAFDSRESMAQMHRMRCESALKCDAC